MEKLREANDRGFSWGGIANDPAMDLLRGDPEFEAIAAQVVGKAE